MGLPSRPRRGFESRWGHQIVFVEVLREGFPSPPQRGRKALVRSATIQLTRQAAVCFGDAFSAEVTTSTVARLSGAVPMTTTHTGGRPILTAPSMTLEMELTA